MALVLDIQKDILDPSVSLSTILRKAKVLAYHLGNAEFKEWVEQELNGYGKDSELPEYRKVTTRPKGQFFGSFGREMKNAPFSTLGCPDFVQEFAHIQAFPHGIGQLESLLESEGPIVFEWPVEFVALVNSEIYRNGDWSLAQAWKSVHPSAISNILEVVRNNLLTFILELKEVEPDIADITLEKGAQVSSDTISQVFHTYISGSQNVVGMGSSFRQSVDQRVTAGDLSALADELESLGLQQADIEDLHKAIEEDRKPSKPGRFGTRVGTWIGKMVGKAATGAWTVAIELAPVLLNKALSNYYGWQ